MIIMLYILFFVLAIMDVVFIFDQSFIPAIVITTVLVFMYKRIKIE